MIKKLFYFLFILAFSSQAICFEIGAPYIQETDWSKAVRFANQNLPKNGVLKRKSDGFVYLKVDDRYIYDLLPMLGIEHEEFRIPPYFRSTEAPGAHISVFYSDENVNPSEVGQIFEFTPKKIRVVRAGRHAKYAILVVESPQLEELRKRYGLSPLLKNHEFHITVGKKRIH